MTDLAEAASAPAARVPDVPCPKCGDANVHMRYCGADRRHQPVACYSQREHFDRCCRRCGHEWRTFDVLRWLT